MSQQGERYSSHEDDWWRQLYDGATDDAGPARVEDTIDDRFASARTTLADTPLVPPRAPEPPRTSRTTTPPRIPERRDGSVTPSESGPPPFSEPPTTFPDRATPGPPDTPESDASAGYESKALRRYDDGAPGIVDDEAPETYEDGLPDVSGAAPSATPSASAPAPVPDPELAVPDPADTLWDLSLRSWKQPAASEPEPAPEPTGLTPEPDLGAASTSDEPPAPRAPSDAPAKPAASDAWQPTDWQPPTWQPSHWQPPEWRPSGGAAEGWFGPDPRQSTPQDPEASPEAGSGATPDAVDPATPPEAAYEMPASAAHEAPPDASLQPTAPRSPAPLDPEVPPDPGTAPDPAYDPAPDTTYGTAPEAPYDLASDTRYEAPSDVLFGPAPASSTSYGTVPDATYGPPAGTPYEATPDPGYASAPDLGYGTEPDISNEATPAPFASVPARVRHVGDRPPTYEAEPTALPQADPDGLGELVADTVLDGACYGTSTLRAASVRGDSARYRGEPRRDSLLTARFGTGDQALVLVAMATGARATAGAHRAAAEACQEIGRFVGRHHSSLAEDMRAGLRGPLKAGLHRLTDRSLGRLRAHAQEMGVGAEEYTATLRCLLLPADPDCRLRIFFGVGPGGLFRIRGGTWQDIEPYPSEAAPDALPGYGPLSTEGPEGDRLTMNLGIPTPPSSWGYLPDLQGGAGGPPAPTPPQAAFRFRFRAVSATGGDTLLLCSPGLAEPLLGAPALTAHLAARWTQGDPPGLAEFLADAQVRVKGYADDRTLAAVWEA